MTEFIQLLRTSGQGLLIIVEGIWNFLSVLPKPLSILIVGLALCKLVIPIFKKFNRI